MSRLSVRALPAAAALAAALSGNLPAQEKQFYVYSDNRPRIGVMLDNAANPEHDKYGAYIREVTPDGPADKAGLKAGDIITSFNGTSLAGVKGEEDASGPASRLRELAGKLEPGDTARVEYRRGSEARKATLVAADLPGMAMGRMQMEGHDGMHRMHMNSPDGERTFVWRDGDGPPSPMPFGGRYRVFSDGPGDGDLMMVTDGGPLGLELATVNAGLGEYFGAKSGALVLDTPADTTVLLKPGDVITAIDGRAVTSEEQARRILRSYADGETAKLDVMRQKKKTTVAWKAPEKGAFNKRVMIRSRERNPGEMRFEVEKD